MTNDEAIKLRHHAYIRSLYLTRDVDLSEDLAHDVIIKYLEYESRHGKKSKQTIQQAILDCERDRIGKPGSDKFENRPVYIQLSQFLKQPESKTFDLDILIGELLRHLEFLTKQERVCVELILLNHPNSYIWKLMGITEPRLCQIRRSAIRKIKSSMEKSE